MQSIKGQGSGSLFIKTHPKSKNLWVNTPLNPDAKISQSVAVFDINALDKGFEILPMGEWSGIADDQRGHVPRWSFMLFLIGLKTIFMVICSAFPCTDN